MISVAFRSAKEVFCGAKNGTGALARCEKYLQLCEDSAWELLGIDEFQKCLKYTCQDVARLSLQSKPSGRSSHPVFASERQVPQQNRKLINGQQQEQRPPLLVRLLKRRHIMMHRIAAMTDQLHAMPCGNQDQVQPKRNAGCGYSRNDQYQGRQRRQRKHRQRNVSQEYGKIWHKQQCQDTILGSDRGLWQDCSHSNRGQRDQRKVDAVDGNDVPDIDSELTVATKMSLVQLKEIDAKDVHFFLLHNAGIAVNNILIVEAFSVSAIVLQTEMISSSVTVRGGVNFRIWGSY